MKKHSEMSREELIVAIEALEKEVGVLRAGICEVSCSWEKPKLHDCSPAKPCRNHAALGEAIEKYKGVSHYYHCASSLMVMLIGLHHRTTLSHMKNGFARRLKPSDDGFLYSMREIYEDMKGWVEESSVMRGVTFGPFKEEKAERDA